MTGRTPSLFRLPPPLVRAMIAGHSGLGLTVAALLFLVALTGTIAMFAPELDRLQEWNEPIVERAPPQLAARAIASLPGGAGSWRRITLEYPTASLPRLILSARPSAGEPRRFIVDSRGGLVDRPPPWTDFLIKLHERLTIPGMVGLIVVGLLGIAMLALAIGGLLAHPRLFRDAFLYRSKAAERTRQADLHNRLSVWPLPFHVVIAFTGAALALSLPVASFIGKMVWGQSPAAVGAALLGPSATAQMGSVPLPDIGSILTRLGDSDTAIQRVIVDRPATPGQIVRVDIFRPARMAYGDRLFFRGDGLPLNPRGMLDTQPGILVLNSLFELHFGTFGGTLLRVTYGLLGTALCVVIASGVRIWLARRRLRDRAMPRLEKLWHAWIWGGPLALLLSFAGASQGVPAAPTFWVTVFLSAVGAVCLRSAGQCRT